MPLFGLLKSKEQHQFDELHEFLVKLKTLMQVDMDFVEGTSSDVLKRRIALVAVNTVMRSPINGETVTFLRNLIDQDTNHNRANPDPSHMGYSIALSFITAWVTIDHLLDPMPAEVSILISSMEGALLGFIERSKVPAWQPCYTDDIKAFEATRRRYVAEHPGTA